MSASGSYDFALVARARPPTSEVSGTRSATFARAGVIAAKPVHHTTPSANPRLRFIRLTIDPN